MKNKYIFLSLCLLLITSIGNAQTQKAENLRVGKIPTTEVKGRFQVRDTTFTYDRAAEVVKEEIVGTTATSNLTAMFAQARKRGNANVGSLHGAFISSMVGGQISQNATGTITTNNAAFVRNWLGSGTANITNNTALYASVLQTPASSSIYSGTITNNAAGLFEIGNNQATVLNQSIVRINSTGGTIVNDSHALRIDGLTTVSPNNYGIYVGNITGGTNNYALRTNTGRVRFGDKVGFGIDPTFNVDSNSFGDGIRSTVTHSIGLATAIYATATSSLNNSSGNIASLYKGYFPTGVNGNAIAIFSGDNDNTNATRTFNLDQAGNITGRSLNTNGGGIVSSITHPLGLGSAVYATTTTSLNDGTDTQALYKAYFPTGYTGYALAVFNGATNNTNTDRTFSVDQAGNIYGKTLTLSDSGALRVPVGTTVQQPATPLAGMIRYNTDTNKFQGYVGGGTPGWVDLN